MINLVIKSAILSISFLFAGFSSECPVNIKLDESLCSKFNATGNADGFLKFNIILKQPVIEVPDQLKSGSDEFSKYYQDSLSRYLKANMETILAIVNNNILYTATSSPDNQVRLTADNIQIDFRIEASASKETIKNIAEKYSIISRLEYYEEYGPTAVSKIAYRQGNQQLCGFLVLNGKKTPLQISAGTVLSSITVYDLHGRTVRTFASNGQYGNNIFTASLPGSGYILSVKNNLGQTTNSLIEMQ